MTMSNNTQEHVWISGHHSSVYHTTPDCYHVTENANKWKREAGTRNRDLCSDCSNTPTPRGDTDPDTLARRIQQTKTCLNCNKPVKPTEYLCNGCTLDPSTVITDAE